MLKKIFILFFSVLPCCLFAQDKKNVASAFDNAYNNEIKLENDQLTERIGTFPENLKALNRQVSQAIRSNNDAKALEIAMEMDKLHPTNADINNFIGKRYLKALDYKNATIYFDRALKLDPKNKWFYINKASVQAEQHDFQEAIKTVDKLIELYPEWSIGYNFKAGLLQTLNKDDEALKTYETATNSVPASALIATNQADLLVKLNQKKEASAVYKRALQIQPDYAPAREKLNALSKATASED